jgi:hypothetical protein
MTHPDIFFCLLATDQASQQCADIDGRLARSERGFIETIAMSRHAIAHSRRLLARFQVGGDALAPRMRTSFSDVSEAVLKSIANKSSEAG